MVYSYGSQFYLFEMYIFSTTDKEDWKEYLQKEAELASARAEDGWRHWREQGFPLLLHLLDYG